MSECHRSSYQRQAQVVTSHSICWMLLLVGAPDTCAWHIGYVIAPHTQVPHVTTLLSRCQVIAFYVPSADCVTPAHRMNGLDSYYPCTSSCSPISYISQHTSKQSDEILFYNNCNDGLVISLSKGKYKFTYTVCSLSNASWCLVYDRIAWCLNHNMVFRKINESTMRHELIQYVINLHSSEVNIARVYVAAVLLCFQINIPLERFINAEFQHRPDYG